MWELRKIGALGVCLLGALLAVACKKSAPLAAPPPPESGTETTAATAGNPPVVADFVAEPRTIERGQSSTLRWSVTNASAVSIDNGVGSVQVSGSHRVFPSDSTTYTLTANGPGGTQSASVTVTVIAPAAPPPPSETATPPRSLTEMVSSTVRDVYFDYDSNSIRGDATTTLTQDAAALKEIFSDFPNATISIEGHCDERGSAEYNLALGDRRAASTKEFLVRLGVPASKLTVISYGKERPQCTEHNEECWQRNRRAHFTTGGE
ncbi:MAG TPA: peptidoglycan-associated lipoprotein Pal [Bryobacteraceae bacterium]|nr:peptidoglycan-associated lipoprotein Pal [Bryobacteraceae bacterium]